MASFKKSFYLFSKVLQDDFFLQALQILKLSPLILLFIIPCFSRLLLNSFPSFFCNLVICLACQPSIVHILIFLKASLRLRCDTKAFTFFILVEISFSLTDQKLKILDYSLLRLSISERSRKSN